MAHICGSTPAVVWDIAGLQIPEILLFIGPTVMTPGRVIVLGLQVRGGMRGFGEISHGRFVHSPAGYHRERDFFTKASHAARYLGGVVKEFSLAVRPITQVTNFDCGTVRVSRSRRGGGIKRWESLGHGGSVIVGDREME